jgi:WD40 repeat protein
MFHRLSDNKNDPFYSLEHENDAKQKVIPVVKVNSNLQPKQSKHSSKKQTTKKKTVKQSKSKKIKSYLKYTFKQLVNGGHKDIITSLVALSKKGYIASGSYDKTIKIWDINKGSLKYTFDASNGGHSGPVWSMVSLKYFNKSSNSKHS